MVELEPPAEGLNLFNSPEYSDVEINHNEIQWRVPDKLTTYHAHKAILSMKSVSFRRQLAAEPDAMVIMMKDNMNTHVFEDFLKVLYGYSFKSIDTPLPLDFSRHIEHVIKIHSLAATIFSAPDVQAVTCAALKVMLSQQLRDSCFTEDYTEENLRSATEYYISNHYGWCGSLETNMGRILCEFLIKEHPTLLETEDMKQMIRKIPAFARDVWLVTLENGGTIRLGGGEH